jgi:hypothetical protein
VNDLAIPSSCMDSMEAEVEVMSWHSPPITQSCHWYSIVGSGYPLQAPPSVVASAPAEGEEVTEIAEVKEGADGGFSLMTSEKSL